MLYTNLIDLDPFNDILHDHILRNKIFQQIFPEYILKKKCYSLTAKSFFLDDSISVRRNGFLENSGISRFDIFQFCLIPIFNITKPI